MVGIPLKRLWMAAVGFLLLAGCSTAAAHDSVGSLGTTPRLGSGCVPLTRGGDGGHTYHSMISGWEVLRNSATTSVTLTSVSLTNPHGVVITGSRILTVPRGHGSLIGNVYPDDHYARTRLAASRAAIGGTLKGGEQVNLILLLRTDGGRMGPVRVTYTDASGDSHLWTGGTSQRFAPIKCF